MVERTSLSARSVATAPFVRRAHLLCGGHSAELVIGPAKGRTTLAPLPTLRVERHFTPDLSHNQQAGPRRIGLSSCETHHWHIRAAEPLMGFAYRSTHPTTASGHTLIGVNDFGPRCEPHALMFLHVGDGALQIFYTQWLARDTRLQRNAHDPGLLTAVGIKRIQLVDHR